jgi:hypothetical protein
MTQMTRQLSQLMDHPSSQGNTPASAPEPKIVLASNSEGGGKKRGEGEPERGGVGGGGGKEGAGKHMCIDFLNLPPR